MAAFRGRSLLRCGFEGVVDVPEDSEGLGGTLASLAVLLDEGDKGGSRRPVRLGGLVSLIAGTSPAIEVSGMALFDGSGGGNESIECGR